MSDALELEEIKRKLERLQQSVESVAAKVGAPIPPEE